MGRTIHAGRDRCAAASISALHAHVFSGPRRRPNERIRILEAHSSNPHTRVADAVRSARRADMLTPFGHSNLQGREGNYPFSTQLRGRGLSVSAHSGPSLAWRGRAPLTRRIGARAFRWKTRTIGRGWGFAVDWWGRAAGRGLKSREGVRSGLQPGTRDRRGGWIPSRQHRGQAFAGRGGWRARRAMGVQEIGAPQNPHGRRRAMGRRGIPGRHQPRGYRDHRIVLPVECRTSAVRPATRRLLMGRFHALEEGERFGDTGAHRGDPACRACDSRSLQRSRNAHLAATVRKGPILAPEIRADRDQVARRFAVRAGPPIGTPRTSSATRGQAAVACRVWGPARLGGSPTGRNGPQKGARGAKQLGRVSPAGLSVGHRRLGRKFGHKDVGGLIGADRRARSTLTRPAAALRPMPHKQNPGECRGLW